MAFMERQVEQGTYFKGEHKTDGGTYFAPAGVMSPRDFAKYVLGYDEDGDLDGYSNAELASGDGAIMERIEGYGARLSAPGYMDCTEWCVFPTEQDAEDYLTEMYGDDEDDEDDEQG